ncbi:MAG TPA: hypothetical protein VKU02_22865 [Gemmataceae bacterium]|nr:hypothetical protein [Gemmataceae bacterium]
MEESRTPCEVAVQAQALPSFGKSSDRASVPSRLQFVVTFIGAEYGPIPEALVSRLYHDEPLECVEQEYIMQSL